MSIKPKQSRNMTADECEELAALLLEDAAALPPGQKQGEILKLVFGYRDLAKNEAFGIAERKLTMLNAVSR